jgi:hypothetical protein
MNSLIESDNYLKAQNWEEIYEKVLHDRDTLTQAEFKLYVLSLNCFCVSDLQPGDIVRAYGLPYRMVVEECIVTVDGDTFYYLDDEPLNPVRCSWKHEGQEYEDSFPPLQLKLIERPSKIVD